MFLFSFTCNYSFGEHASTIKKLELSSRIDARKCNVVMKNRIVMSVIVFTATSDMKNKTFFENLNG